MSQRFFLSRGMRGTDGQTYGKTDEKTDNKTTSETDNKTTSETDARKRLKWREKTIFDASAIITDTFVAKRKLSGTSWLIRF